MSAGVAALRCRLPRMTRTGLVVTVLAVLVVLVAAGCGDDGVPGAGGPDAGPPDGGAPVCAGRGVGDLALRGIYNGQVDYGDGYVTALAMRFDGDPGANTVPLGGTSVPLTQRAQSISATEGDMTDGRSFELTGVDPDCTLHGAWHRCSQGACYDAALLLKKLVRLPEAPAHGLTELGEFDGDPGDLWFDAGLAVNVRVTDDVAYVADYWDGLRIVDVSDPAHLVELGHVPAEFPSSSEIYNDVKIADDGAGHRYALMGSNVAGVVVVDVTDPTRPAIAGHFGTAAQGGASDVHTIFLDGGKAYLANIDLGLEIWNVADPASPTKLGAWALDDPSHPFAFPHDLYVEGDRAYVNYWDGGMAVVDVSDPTAPRSVGTFAGYGEHTSHSNWVTTIGARRIAVHGDEQWGAHVHVVDVTEGTDAFATSIGEWQTRPEVSVHNIMAFGSTAIMAHYQDGVRVLDLSDPTAPRQVAWFDTWPGYDPRYGDSFYEAAVGIDVDVARQRVYVADTHRGLIVLHLDAPL
jgi:hypothetical protein